MFKLPCMVSFESLHDSDWPLFNKRFTVTVGCTWCFLFQGQREPCRGSKLTMHGSLNMKYESDKWKHKNIAKYQRFTRLNGPKREKLGRMKSTGKPDAVKWFWETVSLVQWSIFLFAIYVAIQILTVYAVIEIDRDAFQPPGESKWKNLNDTFCLFGHKLSYDTFG